MGTVLNTALAAMFGFFIIAMFAGALYDASSDASKTEFSQYGVYKNWSNLSEDELEYANTENSVSNMQIAAEAIANKIAEAQQQLNSDDITQQLLGAFGILSALSIDVLFLMLAVMMDGLNFVMGTSTNLSHLEPPFNYFANLAAFGMALFIVFISFKIAASVLKWDL